MTNFTTYVGTHTGVHQLNGDGASSLGLEDQEISAIHAFRDSTGATVILAGSYGNGLFRSADGGRSWQPVPDGLTAPAFRTIGPDPFDPAAILCGTEPARIFSSRDGGLSWREYEGILDLDGYEEWYLPYSPRAGAVRNIYAPTSDGDRLLASVEVGGLLDSHDGGATWQRHVVGPNSDIHHITGHPDDPNLLFASLGYAALPSQRAEWGEQGPKLGGVGRSRDGGRNWQVLHTDYTRATIVPPSHTHLLLAGPAPHVGAQGRIEVSTNWGDTWEPAGHGIDTPMEDMVELFVPAPDNSIWAVCSGGRLLRAEPGEWHWQSMLPDGLEARAVSFVS